MFRQWQEVVRVVRMALANVWMARDSVMFEKIRNEY